MIHTTLLRWAQTIRPATVQAFSDRVAQLAAQVRVTRARKLRVDNTVVQTAIHHPTDSSLLVDGGRVLSQLVRRAKPLVEKHQGGEREIFRSRVRTMRHGLRQLHRLLRHKGKRWRSDSKRSIRSCWRRPARWCDKPNASTKRSPAQAHSRRRHPSRRVDCRRSWHAFSRWSAASSRKRARGCSKGGRWLLPTR